MQEISLCKSGCFQCWSAVGLIGCVYVAVTIQLITSSTVIF